MKCTGCDESCPCDKVNIDEIKSTTVDKKALVKSIKAKSVISNSTKPVYK